MPAGHFSARFLAEPVFTRLATSCHEIASMPHALYYLLRAARGADHPSLVDVLGRSGVVLLRG